MWLGSRCDVSGWGGLVTAKIRGWVIQQNMERSNIIYGKFIGFKIILPLFLSLSDYILYM